MHKLWQSTGSVLSLVITWRFTWSLDGSEFSGGRITGPLLFMADAGILLFAFSILIGLWLRRTSALAALAATLLSLPLSALFLAPGPFRRVIGGNWSVPLQSNFVWDPWTILWLSALLATMFVCVSNLMSCRRSVNRTKARKLQPQRQQ